ncbi:MAG: DinB family protein [Acidobacteriaceae bacterium]
MKRDLRLVAGMALVACFLWAAVPLRAQSSQQADPAKVLDQLLSNYEREFVSLAEAMPANKYNFAPTSGEFHGVRTFAEQVKHVAGANFSYYGSISNGKPANMPNFSALKSKDEIVQALKASFAYAHQVTATITAQNAFEPMGTGNPLHTRAGTAAAAIAHGFDHYGQMVVYLRMNGIVPPASR